MGKIVNLPSEFEDCLKPEAGSMKRLLALYVSTLCFSLGSMLNSKVFNSKDGAGSYAGMQVVNSGAEANQVLVANDFGCMVYDEERQLLYFADKNANAGVHSLMRASFANGVTTLVSLGGEGLGAPLTNMQISKLMLFENGDLLILPNVASAAASNFYVMANPHSTSANIKVYASGAIEDSNGTVTKILNITPAGRVADNGAYRIAVAVSGNAAVDLNTEANAAEGLIWTFTYDPSLTTNQIVNYAGRSKFTATPGVSSAYNNMSLGKTGIGAVMNHGTAATATLLEGVITNVSSICWDDLNKRLYIGTSRSSLSAHTGNLSLVVVGRFGADDGLANPLADDNDLLFEAFAPACTTSIANVSSMRTINWSVNSLKMVYNPAFVNPETLYSTMRGVTNASASLMMQVDYNGFLSNTYVLPVVTGLLSDTPVENAKKGKLLAGSLDTAATALTTEDHGYMASAGFVPTECNDVKSLVGGFKSVVSTSANLSLQVSGQTVFAVLRADSTRPDSAVFASNPIYNTAGSFVGWTPWRKAVSDSYLNVGSGKGTAIFDLAVDSSRGSFVYLGKNFNQTTPVVNEVGSMPWVTNTSVPADVASMAPFLTQINRDFSDTGVWTCASFPAVTTLGLGNCGLTIVGSNNKVAIMSTGGLLTRAPGDSKSNAVVSASNKPYCSSAFSDTEVSVANMPKHYQFYQSVDGIGAILCAAVATTSNVDPRETAAQAVGTLFPATHGFVFVGGQHGIAVLRKANGNGFDTSAGAETQGTLMSSALLDLSDTDAVGSMTWKRIPGIEEDIHDIVSTFGFIYAMGKQKVYRIRLHSKMSELFPTGEQDSTSTMFADTMTFVKVLATEKLNNVSTSFDESLRGLNTTYTPNNQAFKKNVVVIQEVLSLSNGEYCSSMVATPNCGPIFVATNTADGGSRIYSIKLPHCYHANPAEAQSIFNNNASSAGSTDYVHSFSYPTRRMRFETINLLNGNLSSGINATDKVSEATAVVATTTLSRLLINGLYNDDTTLGTRLGVIGNLYVLSGTVFKPETKMYVYEVKGNVAGTPVVGHQVRAPFVYSAVTIDNPTILNEITSLKRTFNFLGNDVDLTGVSSVLAHSGKNSSEVETNNYLNLFGYSDKTGAESVTDVVSGIAAKALVFGSRYFENGAHLLFGAPFGARTQE